MSFVISKDEKKAINAVNRALKAIDKKLAQEAIKMAKNQMKDTLKAQKAISKAVNAENKTTISKDEKKAKIIAGADARSCWSKDLTHINNSMTVVSYNEMMDGVFEKRANILLDDSNKRLTTLSVKILDNTTWDKKVEHIYIIVRNGIIMKIGGTRAGMKGRWSSYLCGHCVTQRNKKNGEANKGKMSVTNAYLYHTIEKDLLEEGNNWEFYSWVLPCITIPINIVGEEVNVIAQTFHAYESVCIKKFKDYCGEIPFLCSNSDPKYK